MWYSMSCLVGRQVTMGSVMLNLVILVLFPSECLFYCIKNNIHCIIFNNKLFILQKYSHKCKGGEKWDMNQIL